MENTQILLRRRCRGLPQVDDFARHKGEIPSAGEGELLCRVLYLSLDPYLRGLVSGRHTFEKVLAPGDVMAGTAVARVEQTFDDRFAIGDFVVGESGWQEFAVCKASECRKIDPHIAPISTALGVLGMPGLTAFVGMQEFSSPVAGETAVVSAALGPVGSTAGQIAKIHGCRVVGIAGSDEKRRYAVEQLGFDACINYRNSDLIHALRHYCPTGIDIYFDNVGGATLEAVLQNLARNARVTLCGLISQYNSDAPQGGPNLGPVIGARATLKGLVVYDHMDKMTDYIEIAARWLRDDKLRYKEDIAEGIGEAPAAFCRLMRGENFGKALVKVETS